MIKYPNKNKGRNRYKKTGELNNITTNIGIPKLFARTALKQYTFLIVKIRTFALKSTAIIFPNQLFEWLPFSGDANTIEHNLPRVSRVILVENELFFGQFNFHKIKLVLHRSSMKFYSDYLMKNGFNVEYIEFNDPRQNIHELLKYVTGDSEEIHFYEPSDNWTSKQISEFRHSNSTVQWKEHANPNFLITPDEANAFFNSKKRYHQTDFYSFQRQRLGILIDEEGKPEGGKLTFDSDNRKAYPKNHIPQKTQFPESNFWVKEAVKYVETHFPHNFGVLEDFGKTRFYPVTFDEARQHLRAFLMERLERFGELEDAFTQRNDDDFVFHSVLTPMLNIGIIGPKEIIDETINIAKQNDIPINSVEGFIRQIIGWREFMRMIYLREGTKQRNSNFFNHNRALPASFYDGTTGIQPIDQVIKKVIRTGYAHHIERLMVLGNFMLLNEYEPHQIYQWFMEVFVDSYDWVMVPNVYGMSQFSDGGLITTKPYFSGSNYLLKMSDYPKLKASPNTEIKSSIQDNSNGGDHTNWQELWDALFWRFIDKNRQYLQSNPRLGMMVITYDKMNIEKRDRLKTISRKFLNDVD